MKRIASSPMEAEKKKQSGIDTSTPSTSPELHGPMSYAEAARSPRREIGPRPRRATVSTIPVPEEGHLAVTEGAIRNNFTVDVLKRNGQDFRGTLKRAEAFLSIFIGALGFPKEEFDGAILGFKGNPTVMFKTKSKFNIDERFAGLATFSYSKNVKTESGEVITHTYECSIRGVRVPGGEGAARANSRYTWVKIEGAEYQVPPAMIKKWLLQYGDLMTDLSEELEELEVSSDEEKELYTGTEMPTGVYSVQMLIKKPIPQFLPMDGKRIKVYHRGIKRMCQNCFCSGHYRVNCMEERVDWMAYIDYFILESGFDEEMFGKWVQRVGDWRITNQQTHEENLRFVHRKQEAEKAKKISLAESRDSIAKTMEEQAKSSREAGGGEVEVTAVESDEWEDANPPAEGMDAGKNDGAVEKMSSAVENMSVEELEKELSIRKEGRPSNEGRKVKAAKKKELEEKGSKTAK
jgi:hypothetical protein